MQQICTIHLIPNTICCQFFALVGEIIIEHKKTLFLTEILVFKINCLSSKEKMLQVTNIEQACNAINCQVETRGYYSQFIDSFSIQISLTTSATVATSKLFCIHQVEICGSCIHPSSFNTNNFSLDLSLKTSTEISR